MANNNTLNVTIACPITMLAEGNQFALTVGLSAADVATFGKTIETINGVDYAIANTLARKSFLYVAGANLTNAAAVKGADLALAQTAQAALVVWTGNGSVPPPTAITITVIVQSIYHGAGMAALEMLRAA